MMNKFISTALFLIIFFFLNVGRVKCLNYYQAMNTIAKGKSATCQLEPSLKRSILKMKNNMIGIEREVKEIRKFQEDCNKQFAQVLEELRNLQDALGEKSCMYLQKTLKEEAKDCADLYRSGTRESGIYEIDPDGKGSFNVFCDMTTSGGGWTVFQRRLDGSVDFYRGWQYYKHGFGDLAGEFWLGLDKINRITTASHNKLRVDMEDITGNTSYAEYDSFAVANEEQKYKMSVEGYSGTAGDSLTYSNGMPFTTKDVDNDPYWTNCAVLFKGAWWHKTCHNANLNGMYLNGPHKTRAVGVNWYKFRGFFHSLKSTSMKIRPREF